MILRVLLKIEDVECEFEDLYLSKDKRMKKLNGDD